MALHKKLAIVFNLEPRPAENIVFRIIGVYIRRDNYNLLLSLPHHWLTLVIRKKYTKTYVYLLSRGHSEFIRKKKHQKLFCQWCNLQIQNLCYNRDNASCNILNVKPEQHYYYVLSGNEYRILTHFPGLRQRTTKSSQIMLLEHTALLS